MPSRIGGIRAPIYVASVLTVVATAMQQREPFPRFVRNLSLALVVVAGCQVLAAPDRLKIPDKLGEGGSGASTSDSTTTSSGGATGTGGSASSSVTSSSAAGGAGGAGPSALGTECKLGSDCETTLCVDGVCCDTACGGACAACSAAKGASQDGACTQNVVKHAADPNACDATHGSCGGGKCVCGFNGACAEDGPAQLAAGDFHTCVRSYWGAVKCFGLNDAGQLGLDDLVARGDAPGELGPNLKTLELGQPAASITAGKFHTCALLLDGTIKCWGRNEYGQLGLGDTQNRGTMPGDMAKLPTVNLGSGKKALSVAAGGFHTCALLEGGDVKCWGMNNYGQLGLGTTASAGTTLASMGDMLLTVKLGTGAVVTQLAVGDEHSCAILKGGSLKCWGSNIDGRLGLGLSLPSVGDAPAHLGDDLKAIDLGVGALAVRVSAGTSHTCAVLSDGNLKCWGKNADGELGIGTVTNQGAAASDMQMLPVVDLGAGALAIDVSVGERHSCAILLGGALKCWGANLRGQLGFGDTMTRGNTFATMGNALSAVDLGQTGQEPAKVIEVAAASEHTGALLDDARVKCWGFGQAGETGTGAPGTTIGGVSGQMGAALAPLSLAPF